MDKNQRWIHSTDVLKSHEDSSVTVPHLSVLTEWVDDMKQWPNVSYINIVNYLVFSEGVDGGDLRSYKSTEAYSYLHSNKIGKVLLKKHSKFICLKAAVKPSHCVSQAKHTAWIILKESGVVQTGGCSCIAGLGKSCSHVGAIPWAFYRRSGRSKHTLSSGDILVSKPRATLVSVPPSSAWRAGRRARTCLSELLMFYTRSF